MKILLDEHNKVLFASSIIEFGIWNEPNVRKWKIGVNEYTLDNNYTVVEVNELPLDFTMGKYFFINESFVENPNFVNSNALLTRLEERMSAIESVLEGLRN